MMKKHIALSERAGSGQAEAPQARQANDPLQLTQISLERIASRIQGRIINQCVAEPFDPNVQDVRTELDKRYDQLDEQAFLTSSLAMRYWPVFLFGCIRFFASMTPLDRAVTESLLIAATVGILLAASEYYTGYNPASHLLINFWRDPEVRKSNELARLHWQVKVKADTSIDGAKGLMALCYPHTRAWFYQSRSISPKLMHDISQAFFALDYNVFDCISASALLFLDLLSSNVHNQWRIERFSRIGDTQFAHSFVVVNRAEESSPSELSNWNGDARILCAWYNVSFSAQQLLDDDNILKQYPLINPGIKDNGSVFRESIKVNSVLKAPYPYLFEALEERFDSSGLSASSASTYGRVPGP